jgi:hypothetical protein
MFVSPVAVEHGNGNNFTDIAVSLEEHHIAKRYGLERGFKGIKL